VLVLVVVVGVIVVVVAVMVVVVALMVVAGEGTCHDGSLVVA
jgi:hypothetical protein